MTSDWSSLFEVLLAIFSGKMNKGSKPGGKIGNEGSVDHCKETSNYISASGMNIWLKVHPQSWMILFPPTRISTSYTCHQRSPVQKGQGDLKYLQIVVLHIIETLKMVLGVTWIVLDTLNVLTTCKM